MRVIYVHGVSERRDEVGYRERLKRRGESFSTIVADPLGHNVSLFTDAPWGHLRPKITLGEETYGTEKETEIVDHFTAEDFRTDDRQLDAAAYFEAAVLRTLLPTQQFYAAQTLIRFLSDYKVSLPFPTPNEAPHETLARIAAIARDKLPEVGESYALPGTEFVETVMEKMKTVKDIILRPRDWIAREMARRWIDVLWYVGSGRTIVRDEVLKTFNQHTTGLDGEPVVVLGHSLGGLVAFDAINSQEFLDFGLQKRARWVLLCFGSQLPIYRQLNIVASRRFNARLNGVARFRNLVDINDPLGFLMDDPNVDRKVRSGYSVVATHSAYLDSAVALGAAKRELKEIFDDWNRKEFIEE